MLKKSKYKIHTNIVNSNSGDSNNKNNNNINFTHELSLTCAGGCRKQPKALKTRMHLIYCEASVSHISYKTPLNAAFRSK